jgi:hypothetical protein
MSKKVEYVHISVKDFLKVKPTGEFDKEESKKMLARFAEVILDSGGNNILFDFREAYAQVPLTYAEIYEFVAALGEHRRPCRSKIAVLTREGTPFDNARFFELCAGNRGFTAAAFTSFEEAINWFSKAGDAREL